MISIRPGMKRQRIKKGVTKKEENNDEKKSWMVKIGSGNKKIDNNIVSMKLISFTKRDEAKFEIIYSDGKKQYKWLKTTEMCEL